MTTSRTYQFPFASYPAVRLAILLIAGIVIDYQLTPHPLKWAAGFLILSVLYICFETLYQRTLGTAAYRLAVLCYMGMVAVFGGGWHALSQKNELPPEAEVLSAFVWEEITFRGMILQVGKSASNNLQLDVDIDSTSFPGGYAWNRPYRLRAVADPDNIATADELKAGLTILFTAKVYPVEKARNPYQFDYRAYLASKNIYTQAGITDILSVEKARNVPGWVSLRQRILEAIDLNFSEQSAPLAKALLIGYKNELEYSQKLAFSRAGLSHIMAVSGLHVGFIIAPFWICIPFFWTLRYGKQAGLFLLLALLFFYAGVTGFSASVCRASLVGGLLAYGRLFHRARDSRNITATAAVLILLVNPADLFDIGFQLSFSAVYVILLIAPVIGRTLPDWVQYRWYGQPIMIVIISFIVQLGLFPLLAYYFGEFSLVGPLANALVVPFLGMAVPVGLLLVPLAIFFPGLAFALNKPVDYFLRGLGKLVEIISGWNWSWMEIQVESLLFFCFWLGVILLAASLPIPKLRWKFLALVFLLLCVDQGRRLAQKTQPPTMQVTVFDVGQGDAVLFRTPGGKHFLIDAGRWQPGYNSARYIILPYLKARGIPKLDAVFLSHPHADHIGGILDLLEEVPIDTIYNSGSNYDSDLFLSYRRRAAQKGIPVVSLRRGDQPLLDSSVRLFVYGPHPGDIRTTNVNNSSLALEVVYGNTEFLFVGDAEQKQERRLLHDYPKLLETDFLKVGHHGSKTSSTADFLHRVRPAIALVSLAMNNRFGHPHPEAVRRLRNQSGQLLFTSLEGAVVMESDGYNIRQKSLK